MTKLFIKYFYKKLEYSGNFGDGNLHCVFKEMKDGDNVWEMFVSSHSTENRAREMVADLNKSLLIDLQYHGQ